MRRYWLSLLCGVVGCAAAAPIAVPLSSAATAPAPGGTSVAQGNVATSAGSGAPVAIAAPTSGARDKEALYQRACDLGSAVGCNDLALRHWDEPKRARELLERACTLELTQGCANLGMLLLPDAKEHSRALQLLEGACKDANAHACVNLGDALYDDPQEWSRAKGSYEHACKLNDAEGCLNVGWMVLRGQGTRADPDRAAEWFRGPCEHDVFEACAGLGYALLDDATSGNQIEQGKHWLQVACDHDSAFGCFMAAQRTAFDARHVTPESRALFAKACRLGSKPACSAANAPDSRDTPDDPDEASEDDPDSD